MSALVFLIGAAAAAGAPFREPVSTACYDPWVKAHPGDFEPEVAGQWSWWPPGITCVHASGEVFAEPSASDAVRVGMFGLVVVIFGIVPAVVAAHLLSGGLKSPRVPGRHGEPNVRNCR